MNAIVYSVWKCRGAWYHKVWGLSDGEVLEIAPHHRGYRDEEKAIGFALASADLLKRKYPQASNLPVVRENSEEWKRMVETISHANSPDPCAS